MYVQNFSPYSLINKSHIVSVKVRKCLSLLDSKSMFYTPSLRFKLRQKSRVAIMVL